MVCTAHSALVWNCTSARPPQAQHPLVSIGGLVHDIGVLLRYLVLIAEKNGKSR